MNPKVYTISEEVTDNYTYHYKEEHLFTLPDDLSIDQFKDRFLTNTLDCKERQKAGTEEQNSIHKKIGELLRKKSHGKIKDKEYDNAMADLLSQKEKVEKELKVTNSIDDLIQLSGGILYGPEVVFEMNEDQEFLNI